MPDLQIDPILNGISTGDYLRQIGSQFGSLWGPDGLIAAEATPDEYAAVGASTEVRLCHGNAVDWLGRRWESILAYRSQRLAQVSIYTPFDDQLKASILARLTPMLGKHKVLVKHVLGWARRTCQLDQL